MPIGAGALRIGEVNDWVSIPRFLRGKLTGGERSLEVLKGIDGEDGISPTAKLSGEEERSLLTE